MYKKIFEGKKAVLFDLEGTIVKQTEGYRKQALEKVLEKLSLSYIDLEPFFVEGAQSKEIWEALGKVNQEIKKHEIEKLVNDTKKIFLELVKKRDLTVTEGFWDLLYELKMERKNKVALVTNTSNNVVKIIIQKLDLENAFDVIVHGGDVKKKKPDPQIFKKALKELGVSPKETLAFEDSYPEVFAAGQAGIDTIVIWNGKKKKKSFKGKIVDFSIDFTHYLGKMDDIYSDYFAKNVIETKDEEQEISNTL